MSLVELALFALGYRYNLKSSLSLKDKTKALIRHDRILNGQE